MKNAEKTATELRGSPIEITICGKKVKVVRMNLDLQMAVIDKLVESADKFKGVDLKSLNGMRSLKDVMVFIVAQVTEFTEDEINASGNIVEVFTAYTQIWEQNGFDFLLQQVGGLNKTLESKKAK